MELLYREEHIICPYYEKSHRPVFELYTLSEGESFSEHARLCKIIFVLEGEMQYCEGPDNCGDVKQGYIFLLPPDKHFIITALTGLKVLVIRLRQVVRFCECFATEELMQPLYNTHRQGAIPNLLPSNEAMDVYARSMVMSLEKGLRCSNYFKGKVKELFYFFRAFYSKQELAAFFSQMLHPDAGFYYLVMQNYRKYKTASDLAAGLNMSLGTFEKHFKKVFSMPAYRWMAAQKAKDIHQALRMEETPIKELAQRFGFATKSTFSAFCRKNLGYPPGSIRKENSRKRE